MNINRAALARFAILLCVSCDCGAEPSAGCFNSADCPAGGLCVDGMCRSGSAVDANISDVSNDPGATDSMTSTGETCSASVACQDDQRCVNDRCEPWPMGGFDHECRRPLSPGSVRPRIQCAWTGPPDDDPAPTFRSVLHTPLVANFGVGEGPDRPARPSIVFISDGTYLEGPPRGCAAAGTLRLIDGATCVDQAVAGDASDRVNSPVTPALGDLDGDGRPEIVAAAADGGLIAFDVAYPSGQLTRLWTSTLGDGMPDLWGSEDCLWGAISLVDLNDDGSPEVFFEGALWSHEGVRLGAVPTWQALGTGAPVAFGDLDNDGHVELIAGDGLWEWNGSTFIHQTPTGSTGYAGFADFGVQAAGQPQIAVVSSGRGQLYSLTGMSLMDLDSGATGGGPPTIADYDGDGSPEFGAAYGEAYVVFDPGENAVLWSRPSQDTSSRRTGSSVFDFNADGRAEVVYGDECFVRVYDGPTGDVIFSQPRFSSTWTEAPIVADVDGDSAAEIVTTASSICRTDDYCPRVDPIFAGLRCDTAADCPGGACDAGLCRCTEDNECGATYGCREPLAMTPGAGNVCRSVHADCLPGIRVYRDASDGWASSRPIWNQHAYHITNVRDDGTIPRTSEVAASWTTNNNFRQNDQSEGDAPGPDLTVGELQAICENANTRLQAQVCNRGSSFLDSGVEVIFRQSGGDELCRLRTTEPVGPGACDDVECVANVQAEGTFEAVVDPDGTIGECREGNNLASGEANCLL